MSGRHPWRTAAFTVLALIGFAANSLLCRAALENGRWQRSSPTG